MAIERAADQQAADRQATDARRNRHALAVLRRHEVTVGGRSGPVLVFGHGFGSDQRVWRRIRAWADHRFRTLAFDMAGAGTAAAAGYDRVRYATPDGFADDLLEVLDAAGVERCIYVGHDLGAMAGTLAALKAPERFERLVLLSAGACLQRRWNNPSGIDPLAVRSALGLMSVNFPRWIREYATLVVGEASGSPSVAEVAACLAAMHPDVAFEQAAALFQADLRGWIDGMAVPTVLVHAADNPLVPPASARQLQSVWPAAALELLPSGGHMPHLTVADRVIGVLDHRLKGVTTA